MASLNSTWIDVRAGLDDIVLHEHQQPYTSFTDCSLDIQSPHMILLIGYERKRQAMENLQFNTSSKPQSGASSGDIRLLVDSSTLGASSPILYADCELHTNLSFKKAMVDRPIGYVISRSLVWRKRMPFIIEPAYLANLLYSKLLLPFSTVICLFADDLRGLEAVAKTLASWLVNLNNGQSDLPQSTHPQVIILARTDDDPEFDEITASRSFNQLLAKEVELRSGLLSQQVKGRLSRVKINEMLASELGNVQVISLPVAASSGRAWRYLRDRIIRASQDVHLRRQEFKVAFSATHFKAFFHLACDHFCNDITTPFSFVRASRIYNPVSPNISQHISTFVQLLQKQQILEFAVPTIASALVLDSFPPGMHCFDPSSVFRQNYLDTFDVASVHPESSIPKISDALGLAAAVERHFCQMVDTIYEEKTNPSTSHQEVLFKFRDKWIELYSNKTCFACLARAPEHSLPCGHSLCDPCTVMRGSSSSKNPWTFVIEVCPLCKSNKSTIIKLKPPTAGVRILSIDGGGVRGITSITWLQELQSFLRLPMPIQEHFDIAVGTSSGGLVVLGLYLNQWSVNECASEFQSLARRAFCSKLLFNLPILSGGWLRKAREILLSFITDSLYGSTGITSAVQLAYRDQRQLLGNSSGTKTAVTATTTEKSSTVVFSNYSGPDQSDNCGYRILRPGDGKSEMFIWEIARATSAAPPFFRPYKGYHDGGLGGHNNPVMLALWEQDSIWQRKAKQPDIVISIGTGSKVDSGQSEDGTVSWLSQLFLPRLLRSFMMLLDGQKTWIDALNSVPQQYRSRYHRLNVDFHGQEPQIDKVESMQDLIQQVRSHATSHAMDLNSCASNLVACLFYFELFHPAIWDRYKFKCKGKILCRLGASTRALRALVVRLRESQAQFYLNSQDHILCVDRDTYQKVKNGEAFERHVEFEVMSKSEQIDFKIDGISQRPMSISNFPYTISDLENDQGFHLVFGRPDHKRRLNPLTQVRKAKRRRYR